MALSMKLSISLVHYFADAALKKCLQSLQQHPFYGDVEILIVNNGSFEPISLPANARLIPTEKNLGYGAAHNRAVKGAQGEYVLLCNPDLEFTESALDRLVACFESHPKAGIVGPKLMFKNGETQDSARSFPTFWKLLCHRLGRKEGAPQQACQTDWLVGAALLMKREVFLQLGGFDERFFLFFEDTDLCRRVKQARYEVWYCPEAVFKHEKLRLSESQLPGGFFFKKAFWHHVASAVKYFLKWGVRSHHF